MHKYKKLFYINLFLFVGFLGFHTDVFALENSFDWNGELAVNNNVYISSVDQLCSFEFDTKIEKIGGMSDTILETELKEINTKYPPAACNLSNPTSAEKCRQDRMNAYKALAVNCPISEEEEEEIAKYCEPCLNYDPNDPVNNYLKDRCYSTKCKNWVEANERPGSDIDVTDYESCIESCDATYKCSIGSEPLCSENESCKATCSQNYDPSESGNSGESGEGGPNVDFDPELSCTSLERLLDFAYDIYWTICIFMGIGLVILGMLDYTKAVMNADQDAIKKATKKFTTRIIIMVIMILLPTLIQWILQIFGIVEDSCIGYF